MRAKIEVHVTLKESILDPQGKTIEHAAHSIGYSEIDDVRIGKFITFYVEAESPVLLDSRVKELCEKLLVNPVIENYTYSVES